MPNKLGTYRDKTRDNWRGYKLWRLSGAGIGARIFRFAIPPFKRLELLGLVIFLAALIGYSYWHGHHAGTTTNRPAATPTAATPSNSGASVSTASTLPSKTVSSPPPSGFPTNEAGSPPEQVTASFVHFVDAYYGQQASESAEQYQATLLAVVPTLPPGLRPNFGPPGTTSNALADTASLAAQTLGDGQLYVTMEVHISSVTPSGVTSTSTVLDRTSWQPHNGSWQLVMFTDRDAARGG